MDPVRRSGVTAAAFDYCPLCCFQPPGVRHYVASSVDTVLDRNLIMDEVRQAHASRLKFYWDSSLNVTEELPLRVQGAPGHTLHQCEEALRGPRDLMRSCWLESPWEPATVLKQDVPILLKTFMADRMDTLVAKMARALDYSKK